MLKASDNPTLSHLATSIGEALEKYNIKQRFPFSAHFTVGRICEQNDGEVGELKAKLPQQIKAKVATAIVLNQFKLKGHDQSEEVFELSGK